MDSSRSEFCDTAITLFYLDINLQALQYKKYSTFSDVWSFGCVLYEMWSLGCKPFEETPIKEVCIYTSIMHTPYYLTCTCMLHSLMISCLCLGSHSDQQWLQTSTTFRMSQINVQIDDSMLVGLLEHLGRGMSKCIHLYNE